MQIQALQVTQSSVKNSQVVETCTATKIFLLKKNRFQPSSGSFQRKHHSVNSAADDDQIEDFSRGISRNTIDPIHMPVPLSG
jgi:hypothetical protein